MNTGNPAFTTLLDEKFIPLSNRTKAGFCLVIILLPVIIFFFVFYGPRKETIHNLKTINARMQTEINDYRQQVALLPDRKKGRGYQAGFRRDFGSVATEERNSSAAQRYLLARTECGT